jgi:hypothetical protein
MSFVSPTPVNPGDAILASLWNQDVVANTQALQDESLYLVTSQTFTNAASVSFNNCFTSANDMYRVMVRTFASGATGVILNMRLRVSGTDNSATNYFLGSKGRSSAAADINIENTSATSWTPLYIGFGANNFSMDVMEPATASRTSITGSGTGINAVGGNTYVHSAFSGVHSASSAFDGFSLFPTSPTTFTGVVRVYKYGV